MAAATHSTGSKYIKYLVHIYGSSQLFSRSRMSKNGSISSQTEPEPDIWYIPKN